MKILDIYKNINSEDDVISQSKEIAEKLYIGDDDGSFVQVMSKGGSKSSKRKDVRTSIIYLKKSWSNFNYDEDLLGGDIELISFLMVNLQQKIMRFIIENKEFISKKQFKHYCWKALENKIIDETRKLSRKRRSEIGKKSSLSLDEKDAIQARVVPGRTFENMVTVDHYSDNYYYKDRGA